jgi:hypothetical protein
MLYEIKIIDQNIGKNGRVLKPFVSRFAVCAMSEAEALAVFREDYPAALVFNPVVEIKKIERRCVPI